MLTPLIRRCADDDWREVRRLHIKLALGFPLVIDVDLNEVFATPDGYWASFVHACAVDPDQALFVAELPGEAVGMGHIRLGVGVGRLSMLYVEGSRRRQHIGRQLVTAQIGWARAAGVTGLVCHIADSSAGKYVAESLGWQRTAEISYTRHGLKEHMWANGPQPVPSW
jgi:GNAT superfamily N-acetyltransferase